MNKGQFVGCVVGAVKIRQDKKDTPRAWVKMADGTWIRRAWKVWKEAGGPDIPRGFVLHHIDGDSLNDDITNLALIARGAHPQFHADKLREKQTGMQYVAKTVKCSRCQENFQGRYQRADAVCSKCRKILKRELRFARYQRTGA